MTTGKIAISLPADLLARVRAAVQRGRAPSVSAYIANALAQQERQESLADLVGDLVKQHGEPSIEDKEWAEQLLRHPNQG